MLICSGARRVFLSRGTFLAIYNCKYRNYSQLQLNIRRTHSCWESKTRLFVSPSEPTSTARRASICAKQRPLMRYERVNKRVVFTKPNEEAAS